MALKQIEEMVSNRLRIVYTRVTHRFKMFDVE